MTPPPEPSSPKPPVDLLRHAPRLRPGMRILFLCHRVPYPPDKGEKIRAFHEIRALARRHRVHLLTLADGPVPDLAPLEALCERVEVFPINRTAGYVRAALGALRPRPLTMSFFESKELARRIREIAAARESYDVAVAYSSSMGPYLELLPDLPAVMDMVDVDSAKWEQYARFAPLPLRPVYALEAKRLRAYETELARRLDCVTLATAREARLLQSFAPEARVATVVNGVDLEFFKPLDLPKAPRPTLVFTGQMDYFANVDGITHFARRVFPRLRERFPDLELLVVGRSPVPAVRELGDLPGVLVTGAVGDVRPFLARAWAFVAPLRIAQGVQNKVLEAMASSLPVVCSDRVHAGISEGGFRPGRDLLAAGTDEEMVEAIASLLEDPEARDRLAECAYQRLVASYRWAPNLERFEELIAGVARPAGPAPVEERRLFPEEGRMPEPLAGGARSA
ncbi:MAG TPA: TIGR03087 family PEP-CTERM/XrtA system glycosyltransferase [Thermoanaerobaculia bacterium]|nr:TIGR03087 family PEP-CTERM/XrtA system glycosyltransferase [Thermoanaerobaculia bacterium]